MTPNVLRHLPRVAPLLFIGVLGTGCQSDGNDEATASESPTIATSTAPSRSDSPSDPGTPSTSATEAQVVPCSSVPKLPTNTEIDRAVDQDQQLLTLSYRAPDEQEDRSYTIAYATDASCMDRADLQRVIRESIP